MTDNTMREAFENCSLHDDYVEVKSLEENRKWFSAGWQAAQSVPVVGEPVGFILIHENGGRNLTFHDNTDDLADGWSQHKLIIQPTTSITAQELYALRKDVEKLQNERLP